jgi:hypothetical protein
MYVVHSIVTYSVYIYSTNGVKTRGGIFGVN